MNSKLNQRMKQIGFGLKYSAIFLLLVTLGTNVNAQGIASADKVEGYVNPANIQFKAGNWAQGKAIVDEGLNKYPKYSDLKMLLGMYYLHFKQYDDARYELKKALEYNPENVDAKQLLVNLETETKRYSSAICYVNELLQVNPYWKGLWEKKISLYELQGNQIEANMLRKRLLQIYPNDEDVKKEYTYSMNMEASKQQKQGNLDAAISLHKEAIESGAKTVQGFLSIVNDYLKAGDSYNALAYTERGLNKFPHNQTLVMKKVGILADQKRYDELLPFLQKEGMGSQYNYYLLEAARNAKNQDPGTLYGKILLRDPGNEEAFSFVFDQAVSKGQYDRALVILNNYRKVKGNSKALSVKELNVYKKMGNSGQVNTLTKELFQRYPEDQELQEQYAAVMVAQAKNNMEDGNYQEAIQDWYQVLQYGGTGLEEVAQVSIYNACLSSGQYNKALNSLNDLILSHPADLDLYVKQASIYFKQEQFYNALTSYEKAVNMADDEQRQKYLGGYGDMQTKVIKGLIDTYEYQDAITFVNRWLQIDSTNKQAIQYAVNLSNLTNDKKKMLAYAERGHEAYPDDPFFKVKIAEVNNTKNDSVETIYYGIRQDLNVNPYNKDLINTFSVVANKFGLQLLHKHEGDKALAIVDTALLFAPDNDELKYTKGLAFEYLKVYDSASVYQSYYKPGVLEEDDFKRHLNYLNYKSNRNEISIFHLRSRFGDQYTTQTISSMQYTRFDKGNTYAALLNYAGRTTGKGYQLQFEWQHDWDSKTNTVFNIGWANQFFPTFNVDASIFKNVDLLGGINLQLGGGIRKLSTNTDLPLNLQSTQMTNVVVGVTKVADPFRLNLKLNNFFLGQNWLYNLSFDGRYYMSSPKDYIMAVASIGTSPDVELIDYSLYNGFKTLNTTVGVGAGRMVYKNVAAGILGNWINYETANGNLRNLYNIYFTLNVSF